MVYEFDPDLAPVVPTLPRFDISDVAVARTDSRERVLQAPALPTDPTPPRRGGAGPLG